ncbi:OLC1v1005232C1 [Oldenlandia corymbosa var. corymbosa]|uniref:OLC1v1005232C1 n=1 Tax=Oldenlandia corymbosa var. corymbosa TaxID=529605 RepID=A0AAV1DFF6_OLDCO|nr:OLC1v1005232C1 [Oldenlandia corymbosa var. corymbosa]
MFLSVGGLRLFPFKNRKKFAVITWPSLEELSPTPSSGNIEVEEESLNQDQGLENLMKTLLTIEVIQVMKIQVMSKRLMQVSLFQRASVLKRLKNAHSSV